MRPLRLCAENFKGIKDGLGKDLIEIDLSGLSGIAVINGQNGQGKSTLLNLMHPFPYMPDHGRDIYGLVYGVGYRELEFLANGQRWLSKITIDSNKRQSRFELFAHRNGQWTPAKVDGITSSGTQKTYMDLLERVVCPEALYFKSAFQPQLAEPIAKMSTAELQNLFVQALDIPALEILSTRANQVVNQLKMMQGPLSDRQAMLEKESNRLSILVNLGYAAARLLEPINRSIAAAQSYHECCVGELAQGRLESAAQAGSAKQIQDLNARIGELNKRIAGKKQESATKINNHQKEASSLRAKLAAARQAAKDLEEAIKKATGFEAASQALTYAENKLAVKRKAKLDLAKELEAFAPLVDKKAALESELSEIRANLLHTAAQLDRHLDTSDLMSEVPCASEGKYSELKDSCPLLEQARRAESEIDPLLDECEKLEFKQASARSDLVGVMAQLKKRDRLLKLLEDIENEDQELINQVTSLRSQKDSLQEACNRVAALEASADNARDHEARLSQLEADFKAWKDSHERDLADLDRDLSAAQSQRMSISLKHIDLAALEAAVAEAKSVIDHLTAKKDKLQRQVNQGEGAKEDWERVDTEIKSLSKRLSSFRDRIDRFTLLGSAFSKKGIIAMEIKDVGPELTREANALLTDVFDGRFQVTIMHDKDKKAGGQKVVLDIMVHDSLSNFDEPKSLNDISPGEATMVVPSISQALALLNASRSNNRLQAVFLDEVFGNLYPANRGEAFRMFREFCVRGGFELAVVISQEEEIWSLADHVITFDGTEIHGLDEIKRAS
jgi:DNA repair exonuclease SbcCD ATPase subunit